MREKVQREQAINEFEKWVWHQKLKKVILSSWYFRLYIFLGGKNIRLHANSSTNKAKYSNHTIQRKNANSGGK